MLVVDASALIEVLLQTETGIRWRDRILQPDESLHAPHLIDIEVMSALRRWTMRGELSAATAELASENLSSIRISRYAHLLLLPRIWQLRANITAYDAAYIALAETIGVPLVTCDAKLARTHGHAAQIVLVE